MTFPIKFVPLANVPPRDAQPAMLQNVTSINNLIDVDHITFGNATGGQHKKITYVQPLSPVPLVSSGASVAYTILGIADPSVPQNVLKTEKAVLPLSCIRAFASFLSLGNSPNTNTPIIPSNSTNITSITQTNDSVIVVITITLDANCVTGSNYCKIFSTNAIITGSTNYSTVITNNVIVVTGKMNTIGNRDCNIIILQM